jgi:hypothetical protein
MIGELEGDARIARPIEDRLVIGRTPMMLAIITPTTPAT